MGFTGTTYTTSVQKANLFSFVLAIPVIVIYLAPFMAIWTHTPLKAGWESWKMNIIPVFIVGTVVHELLHGLVWMFYAKGGFRVIRFGIKWGFLTPCCHCKKPLKKNAYLLGVVMPLIVTGFIPAGYGMVTGDAFYLIAGILFTLVAGGDIMALWMLRKVKKHQWVADHPDEFGFVVLENGQTVHPDN